MACCAVMGATCKRTWLKTFPSAIPLVNDTVTRMGPSKRGLAGYPHDPCEPCPGVPPHHTPTCPLEILVRNLTRATSLFQTPGTFLEHLGFLWDCEGASCIMVLANFTGCCCFFFTSTHRSEQTCINALAAYSLYSTAVPLCQFH